MEKRNTIIYWIATGLMAFGMLVSGLQQIFRAKAMADMLAHLGYPLYFMNIIGVWKVLGVIVILIPGFKLAKEWAYAGLFFAMTGALVSHLASGDYGVKELIGPLMQTVFIILSWYFRPVDRKIISVN
ncbi:MAG: DoxX family protein [Mucilaginibacter sp.]|uniref:DoxX family protein n=1 Tax=Mucilaginibacter sp. TaxID=1882438 RepID=UPI0032635723